LLGLGRSILTSAFTSTHLGEDFQQADFWVASILAQLPAFFITASMMECTMSKLIG
jgi:hypothetical protein